MINSMPVVECYHAYTVPSELEKTAIKFLMNGEDKKCALMVLCDIQNEMRYSSYHKRRLDVDKSDVIIQKLLKEI